MQMEVFCVNILRNFRGNGDFASILGQGLHCCFKMKALFVTRATLGLNRNHKNLRLGSFHEAEMVVIIISEILLNF